MARYRVCKMFEVESGHMLSKHPESCRFPHGHTRKIEVVVSAQDLDSNDMVLDFKALKLALENYVNRLDHKMALNSRDPLRIEIERVHPEGTVVYEDVDPTTEVLARDIYDFAQRILATGFKAEGSAGITYVIEPGRVHLERVRVWETATSWAEFGS